MGLKLQSFQFFQFGGCFSNNARRTHPLPQKSSSVKVIGLNGQVKNYHRRVKADELMKEHACHLVCRSDSFFIGQKLQPLSAADELQMGESYFILPSQYFQPVLSFVTVASWIAKGRRCGGGSLRHFDIHKTGSGKLQIRISEEVEEKIEERERDEIRRGEVLCTTKKMAKEYEKLVRLTARRWRPKLEEIEEIGE